MVSKPPAAQTRRDLLTTTAIAFVSVGAAAAGWPLLHQMEANRSSERRTVVVDVAGVRVGETKLVAWEGQPIAIRRRGPSEIEAARTIDLATLRDGLARTAGIDPKARASDENRTKPGHPSWLVVMALCPRNRCLLRSISAEDGFEPGTAWICPCDNCRFDTSGRVRSGPAAENLAVPPYRFDGALRMEIGAV